ncbi:autotransporter serine protease [Mesorhizobium sp. YR577]|uniref:autotransporter domain-containing protein n=1 Tax=Mesorhizobium sp. YR577 TaxID=1884373 RepID=UPI0008E0CDE3|nr:autotransporter serine protease [Mesorhizobium sp. YR577]SFT77923.1 subtilase-type serine protease [Mesorhizobium sp. YR577]
MNSRNRSASHIAALLLSTALCGSFSGIASAQTAGDPANPETWRTPEYLAQWGLETINAADAYAKGVDGSGVTVGVVDSGFDTNHPEFVGRYVDGITYDPSKPWNIDTDGHGTGVASVIAANRDSIGMHGVAPGATIAMVNVDGDDGFLNDLGAQYGISLLVDRGVRIINNSYGSFPSITDTMTKEDEEYLARSLAVYRRAVAADTLLIWATMNDGRDQPSLEAGLPYLFPELERGWLAVTAVGPDYVPDWANRCGVAKNWCLAAPGGGPGWKWNPSIGDYVWHGVADGIYVAKPDGGYQKTLGTSFAAPHVAGTAALVAQMFPYMTMEQVRQVLLGTAWDVGAPGVDEIFGYGLLDAGKAVLGPGKFDWGDFHAVIDEGESWWENDITGDGGLIKSGNGVLILSGDSTYLGDTRVDSGILVIGGSIASDTFVEANALLSGDGTIFGNVDNHGGVLGGWSRDGGTLTIDGNYRQRQDSWLLVELGAPDGTSRLDVSGTATIEGGSLDIRFGPGGYKGDERHTIITAGSVTGQFEYICSCYAFLDFDLTYDPTNVYLDVARNSVAFADVATTRNGAAVAGGIESLGVNNLFYGIITTLNEEEAAVAFNQLTGEVHASLAGTLVTQSNLISDAASSRLRAAFADAGAPALPVMAFGPDGPELAPATTDRFAVWSQVLGAWGERDGTDNAVGLEHSIGGVLFGGDAAVGDAWRLGVLGGYSQTTFESRQTSSSGSSKNIHLGLYAGAEWGAVALRTGAAYTWHDIETRRAPRFSSYFYDFDGRPTASYDAGTAQVFGELGYRLSAGNLRLEPFAGLAHASVRSDGFAETGSGMGLVSAASTTDVTFTTLGAHAATDFAIGSLGATARGMLGWRHAFGDTVPTSTFAFAGGTPFAIEGLPIATDALAIEAGLDLQIAKAATLGFAYAGQLASKAQDQSFKLDLAVRF